MSREKQEYFDNILKECSKAIKLTELKPRDHTFQTVEDYEKSLSTILKGVKFTDKQKKQIDTIVYNNQNNDGLVGASIIYNFVGDRVKTVIPLGSGKEQILRNKDKLTGKNVAIVDLYYDKDALDQIQAVASSILVIDDHKAVPGMDPKVYFTTNDTHSACEAVWKIFYPDQPVPFFVQAVGFQDSKLSGAYIPYTNFIASFMSFRYTSNPYKPREYKESTEILKDIWKLIENSETQMMAVIGKFFDEVMENIKTQIARNAVVEDFQGYKVVVLNHSDPVLTKRIGRQMITNMENRGTPVDFAVLWAYEHNKKAYRVQLIDDHRQTKINLGDLARQLGKIGGHPKGGGGHNHVGNFYWKKDKTHDIDDLFSKKLI